MFEPLHPREGSQVHLILFPASLPIASSRRIRIVRGERLDVPLQTNYSAPHFHAWQLTFNAIAMNNKRRSRLTVQPLGLETACSVLAQIPWSGKILFKKLIRTLCVFMQSNA